MSYQIGEKVRITSHRPNIEQYNGAIGEVTEIPTQGLIRVVVGRLSIAFTDSEVEKINAQIS